MSIHIWTLVVCYLVGIIGAQTQIKLSPSQCGQQGVRGEDERRGRMRGERRGERRGARRG